MTEYWVIVASYHSFLSMREMHGKLRAAASAALKASSTEVPVGPE